MSQAKPESRSESPDLKCPTCGKKRAEDFKPFCSKRCAEVDLSRWLKGGYAIPGREADEGDGRSSPQGGEGEN